MIIKEVYLDELFSFIKDFVMVNESIQNSSKNIDKIELTGKAEMLLENIHVMFSVEDVSMIDLYHLKRIGSIIKRVTFTGHDFSPLKKEKTLCGIHCEEKSELEKYRSHMYALYNDYTRATQGAEHQQINLTRCIPCGSLRYKVNVFFRGGRIQSLFNGFMTEYIHRNIKNSSMVDDPKIQQEIFSFVYQNFIDLFSNSVAKLLGQKGIIEDYLNQNYHFGYVKREMNDLVIHKIHYGEGVIQFVGNQKENLTKQIESFKNYTISYNGQSEYDNIIPLPLSEMFVYYDVCTDFRTFMELMVLNDNIQITAYEPLNSIALSKTREIDIDQILSDYIIRFDRAVNANREIMEVVKKECVEKLYDMIPCGTKIKYVIRCDMGYDSPTSIQYPIIKKMLEMRSKIITILGTK